MDARKLGFEVYVIEDATRAIDLNGSLAAAWPIHTAWSACCTCCASASALEKTATVR